jgi:hypothetical protein
MSVTAGRCMSACTGGALAWVRTWLISIADATSAFLRRGNGLTAARGLKGGPELASKPALR